MGFLSAYHTDIPWCTVGWIIILYHCNVSVNTAVNYDERPVFGSHGLYATWTGTAPRDVSVTASLVAANTLECLFNALSVYMAHDWTQESPPICRPMFGPGFPLFWVYSMPVRILNYSTDVAEGVHLDIMIPIQINLSLSLKECKAI